MIEDETRQCAQCQAVLPLFHRATRCDACQQPRRISALRRYYAVALDQYWAKQQQQQQDAAA